MTPLAWILVALAVVTVSVGYRDEMGSRRLRPPPDLDGSTLRYVGDGHYVDVVTGMVLSRLGHVGPTGYERLQHEGREIGVHRLVAEAVHGPAPEGCTSVNHLNGIRHDNRPQNLAWATQSDQVRHAYEIGLRPRTRAAGSGTKSRLSAEQVGRIREAVRGTVGTVAAELGISRQYAYDIRHGRRLA